MPKLHARCCARAKRAAPASLRLALVVAASLLWAGRAGAVTVALLRPASDSPALDEALFRLKGELLAVGTSVVIFDHTPAREADSAKLRAWLLQAAEDRGIDAFVDVVGDESPQAADVWICERAPPFLRLSRVELEPELDDRAATLAIRTIEVLRSSFLATDLAAKQSASSPVSTKDETPRETSPRRARPGRFAFEAGVTAVTSFDGVGPAFLPLARVEGALGSWLAVQATAAAFGSRPRIETAAGHVDVARAFGLAGLCLCSAAPELALRPFAALSLGALRTELDGEANAPNQGHRVRRWAALADASAGARWGLPASLYLSLAGHVALAEPYVAVHVLDTVVATTGRPNVLVTFSVGARP